MAFTSMLSYSQNCPEFKVTVHDTNDKLDQLGSIEVVVRGGAFDENNFQLRQKLNSVNGMLDFDYDIEITGNKIVFSNLPGSDQLVLKNYAVLYYDKFCKDGEVIEVGQFQIK